MESLFDEDEEAFDLAAIEARHAEMEAQEELDKQEKQMEEAQVQRDKVQAKAQVESGAAGIYPASDWEAIVEAVLFTMGNSVELRQLATAIDQSEAVARRVVENLQRRYQQENRGMQIITLENAYQMSTQARFYENLIRVASAPKKHVLTDVVLETLSIIAYKQPVTKMEISKIRGVSSDHAVNRLVEYGLVYEAGRMDAPGRPALFATTEEFLRRFGVGSTTDLPTMNPEQEEEIKQEVEEELQMKLEEYARGEAGEEEPADAEGEAGAEPECSGERESEGEEPADAEGEAAAGAEPEIPGEAENGEEAPAEKDTEMTEENDEDAED